MPTLAGLRRRGYTPEAIRAFCERIGVAKADSVVDVGLLEHGLREDLEPALAARDGGAAAAQAGDRRTSPRGRCASWMRRCTPRIRRRARARCRSRASLYVERDDFREDPPKDWFRLAPGREVRLRYACLVTLHAR